MTDPRVSTYSLKAHACLNGSFQRDLQCCADLRLFLTQPAALAGSHLVLSPRREHTESKQSGSLWTAAADRKLLTSAAAMDSVADHSDYSRLDRELAAAFRVYGVDLDVNRIRSVKPAVRLAGHPTTPEIATFIDRRACLAAAA